MKISIGLILLVTVAYIVGAKFPGPVTKFWPARG